MDVLQQEKLLVERILPYLTGAPDDVVQRLLQKSASDLESILEDAITKKARAEAVERVKQHTDELRRESQLEGAFVHACMAVINKRRHRYAVTEAGLEMALGNAQNTGKRKIFWKENPKQSREYVQGKPNHAFGQTDEPKAAGIREREYVNGRKNHSYVEHKSGNEPSKPQPKVDAWKEIVDLYMRRWTTHGQKATLEAEYELGIATGKSWVEIGASLGQMVKGWERGR